MGVLSHLEPKGVLEQFERICTIPHGSFHTKAISDYLVDFARKRGLSYTQDAMNNVIITKNASAGYAHAAPVILQGHMDMVCEKAADCDRDMLLEGLELAVDGDTIYAKGTTLGGDDGIAVAMMLALLDGDYPHPPLECIFTVEEEVGLLGAAGLDMTQLQGRRMLNLDSEDEGVFTVSCAGGATAKCELPIQREDFDGTALSITVTGGQGGHSGAEIDKGRANSNRLMGRILYALSQATTLRLVSVAGGLKDNAIPRETVAHIVVANAGSAAEIVDEMDRSFRNEYAVTDCDIRARLTAETSDEIPMDAESTRRTVAMLQCLPGGIEAMSADIPGLVQTSLNMGILDTNHGSVTAVFSVRSSVASHKQMLLQRIACLMELLCGTLSVSGDYPGWQYRAESPLRDLMVEVFTEQYGHAPRLEAIHAGLECGLFSDGLPGLDCVSYGPDLKNIHTCRETMSLASVQRVWRMTLEALRRMN